MPNVFNLTKIDLAILGIVAAFFLRSFLRGAVREFFSLLGIGAGLFAALRLGGWAGALLGRWTGEGPVTGLSASALAFLAVWVAVGLTGRLIAGVSGSSAKGLANRLLAGALGAAKGLVLTAAVVAALDAHAPLLLPPADGPERLLPFLRSAGARVLALVPEKVLAEPAAGGGKGR